MLRHGNTILVGEDESKLIEDIKVKENILTYDLESKKIKKETYVDSLYICTVDYYNVICLENGDEIYCSGRTRVFTKNRGICLVDDLRHGDLMVNVKNESIKVSHIKYCPVDDEVYTMIQMLSNPKELFFVNNYLIAIPL